MTDLLLNLEKVLNAYMADDNVDHVTKKEALEEIRDSIDSYISELEEAIEENEAEGEGDEDDKKADPPEAGEKEK